MKLKRLLASLLVLCLTLTLLPSRVQAAETAETTVDNGSMTVEGTNGFGNLLSTEIAESQSEEAASGCQAGYSVTELTFDGSTATVTYAALEEAILVVAVYTEDGLQMLASGKTTVSPDVTQATVVIEGDVPEYFYAGAFLMDREDYVPLCENYSTPMYTREMQELLTSTTDDYDPSLVYNLDDDKTKNFAVFAEDTVVVREQAGVNTVTGADDTNRVYVIENADEAITSLQQGDVLAYPYGEGQILIVKVDTITLDGTTATITGTDLEMEEVFSHVKIEGESDTSDISVDDSSAADYVTYLGLIENGTARSVEGGPALSRSHTFEIEKQTYKEESEHLDINAEFGATFKFELEVSVDFYISPSQKYLEFKATSKMGLYIDISGKITGKIPIGEFAVSPCAGVYVKFEPKVEIEFNGSLEIDIPCSATLGFRYDNVSGVTNISKAPKPDFNFKIQCSIFIGVDFNPKLIILSKNVVSTKATALAGLEFVVKDDSSIHDDLSPSESRKHSCAVCTKTDIAFVARLDGSITFLGSDRLTVKVEIGSWKVPIGKMYYSLTYDEFGFGSCPYITYKTTIVVLDEESNPAKGKAVFLWDTENTKTTNEHGIVEFYLNNGSHDVMVYFDSATVTMQIIVKDDSQKVIISEAIHTKKPSGIEGSVDSETVTDYTPLASGTCGESVRWALYSDGLLSITGSGEMTEYNAAKQIPWFWRRDSITSVIIGEEVTNICRWALYDCDNLVNVTIGEDVSSIDYCAFTGCDSLTSILIPGNVISIGDDAFHSCVNLSDVVICSGVTSIGSSAFSECSSLTSLILPDGVTIIANEAFYCCDNLTSIRIPNSVTIIGYRAFYCCDKLYDITIPDGVVSIGSKAFYECDSLTNITIPSSVDTIGNEVFYDCNQLTCITIEGSGNTTLGEEVFYNCDRLSSVTVGDGVVSIGHRCFYSCEDLSSITLGDHISDVGSQVFYNCRKLTDITIPGSITEIGSNVFENCISLSRVVVGDGIERIGNYMFNNCQSLTFITIPDSVSTIGEGCFSNCTALNDFVLPSSIQTIENRAFNNCDSLESIVIPESVISIGTGSFSDCDNLSVVTLPSNISEIPAALLRNCDKLTTIHLPQGVTKIGTNAFFDCDNLVDFLIPDSVSHIGDSAFGDCDSLVSISIPSSVSSLNSSAFCNSQNLEQIIVDSSNNYYSNDDYGALLNKEKDTLLCVPCGLVGSYTIPDSVTRINSNAFENCDKLTYIIIPDSVTHIGTYAFSHCDGLTSMLIPSSVTTVGESIFRSCSNLASVAIEMNVAYIPRYTFEDCTSLLQITIPANIVEIGYRAFSGCTKLSTIVFCGNAPEIKSSAFSNVTATAYYPADNSSWYTAIRHYGGTLTWVPYTLDEDGSMVINEAAAITATTDGEAISEETAPVLPTSFTNDLVIDEQPTDEMTPDAVYGGEYATEITDTYTLKTATFSGLVPGAEYVMLAMVSIETEDPLAADNLLGILQATAGTDGTLVLQYVQRVDTDVSYVVACGASNKDLADAEIAFPEMTADGTLQVVNPSVTYGGKSLTEGVDYEIIGTVDFTDPGEYTCQIRGIHNYTGLVTCTYTVTGNPVLFGDLTGDGEVDIFDANLIVAFYNGTADLTAEQQTAADVNGDGEVDIFDANLVVSYYNGTIAAFPVEE